MNTHIHRQWRRGRHWAQLDITLSPRISFGWGLHANLRRTRLKPVRTLRISAWKVSLICVQRPKRCPDRRTGRRQ